MFQAVLVLMLVLGGVLGVQGQGTAFTYQGRLASGNVSAAGLFDLQFTLCDAATNGASLAVITNNAVPVTNGLFTVALDFGAQFTGAARWLELAVRTNGVGEFTPLLPRQPLTPSPYAVFAGNAGSVAAANISGTLAFNQIATNAFGSAAFLPANVFASATNFGGYDIHGRPTMYLPSPFTTNIGLFTNRYSVVFADDTNGYNGTYTWWPEGSTNFYTFYTNVGATRLLMRAPGPDELGWSYSATFWKPSQFPITFYSWPDYDNNFVNDDPAVRDWIDDVSGALVQPVITGLSSFLQTNVTTNFSPTILTNVYLANFAGQLVQSLKPGMVGVLGPLPNSITGQVLPPVLVTNTGLTLGWLADSIGAGYQAHFAFPQLVDDYIARVMGEVGHTGPFLNFGIFSGITSYYFSTNAGTYWGRNIMFNETGINDLRFGLTNWGAPPDVSLINSQSNMIRRAAAAGAKLFVLTTLPDWCSYTQYTNLGTAAGLTGLLGTNITWTTNNNGYTYGQFLQELQNVRRWQLAQITNTAIPVLVVDLKTLPIDQCLADGLHPNDFGQQLIGRLMVQSLQLGWCPQVPTISKQSAQYEDAAGPFTVYPHRNGTNVFFSTEP